MDINEIEIRVVDCKVINLSFLDTLNPRQVDSYKVTSRRFQVFLEEMDNKFIWINTQIQILALPSIDKDVINEASCELSCSFEISNISEALEVKGGKINNTELLKLLFETSYSTGRGLLARELKGTIFQNAYLPIVKQKDLMHGFEKIVQKITF